MFAVKHGYTPTDGNLAMVFIVTVQFSYAQ